MLHMFFLFKVMKEHIIRRSKFLRPIDHSIFSDTSVRSLGFCGLVASSPSFIYERHILALSRVLKFHFKRKKKASFFRINFFLNKFVTKKAIGVRMGKGKGATSEKVFYMRPGFFILFINEINNQKALYVINKCKRRLPVNCRTVFFDSW
uniref:Ribosomal protein L16 n=1 Tax=Balamuthia mandrillaris TaxID=66527 RepID=A0A0K1HRZ0_9EUKA|nr:ribosomal protein L16 [Balamuthia mandrillaris]AKT94914.1 ribosomal protein L16 [Balamuthia mandrillaris]